MDTTMEEGTLKKNPSDLFVESASNISFNNEKENQNRNLDTSEIKVEEDEILADKGEEDDQEVGGDEMGLIEELDEELDQETNQETDEESQLDDDEFDENLVKSDMDYDDAETDVSNEHSQSDDSEIYNLDDKDSSDSDAETTDLEDSEEKQEEQEQREYLQKSYRGFSKFSVTENAHETHQFRRVTLSFSNEPEFNRAYQREVKLLREGLPDGIFVKAYEDRMDLFSALIMGPEGTPYEGSLFLFDIKLPDDYPRSPPLFYFHSFVNKELNPNLYYDDGKVCLSLLGTWASCSKCERWSRKQSSLLQVLVSIQGLILVPEPFYNEPGYVQKANNPEWEKMSRNYNESIVGLLLIAMATKLQAKPAPWQQEIASILKEEIPKTLSRVESWIKASASFDEKNRKDDEKQCCVEESMKGEDKLSIKLPDFPLLPIRNVGKLSKAVTVFKMNSKLNGV